MPKAGDQLSSHTTKFCAKIMLVTHDLKHKLKYIETHLTKLNLTKLKILLLPCLGENSFYSPFWR